MAHLFLEMHTMITIWQNKNIQYNVLKNILHITYYTYNKGKK